MSPVQGLKRVDIAVAVAKHQRAVFDTMVHDRSIGYGRGTGKPQAPRHSFRKRHASTNVSPSGVGFPSGNKKLAILNFSVIVDYNTRSQSRVSGDDADRRNNEMRGFIIQYFNEIIGLTVLILMGLALISGEAAAIGTELPVVIDTPDTAVDLNSVSVTKAS